MLRVELTSKQVSFLLGRSEDWLRHARSTHKHWNTPPFHKDGRRVFYLVHEVMQYAHEHGIQIASLRGPCASAIEEFCPCDTTPIGAQAERVGFRKG